ncbi:MAG: hypothetical protein ACEQSH_00130 [Bacteroidia bacterium]
MSGSTGKTAFKLGYQLSPVILSGTSRITSLIPYGLLPIMAITESINFTRGLLNGAEADNTDDFFAHFWPLPGSTLFDSQYGSYPFANGQTAANSAISQPKVISLRMDCPAKGGGAYLAKLATMAALRRTLELHCSSGGTFIVATPSYIYTNCLLMTLRDVSANGGHQAQTQWQWDFQQPLISLDDANSAENTLMSQFTGGLVSTGDLSGSSTIVGRALSGVLAAGESLVGSIQSAIGGVPAIISQPLPPL